MLTYSSSFVLIDGERLLWLVFDYFVQQHSKCPARAYPACHICIFRVFAYRLGNIKFKWRTSSFSPHKMSHPLFKTFIVLLARDNFVFISKWKCLTLSPLLLPTQHFHIGLHGLKAGWVQLTACKASLLRGVSCNRMWLERLIKIQNQSRGFVCV